MPIPLLALCAPLTVAAGLAVTSVLRYRTATTLLRTGRRVPGQIIDVRPAGPGAFSPIVRFRTRDDHEVIARPHRRQTTADVRGDRVTVVYDASRPTRIVVDGAGFSATDRRAQLQLTAGLAGGAAVAAAGVAAFLALR